MRVFPKHRLLGFNLIELMVTLMILGVLASVAVPLAELAVQRNKEHELRSALITIREALDAYKQAGEEGLIERHPDGSGYPASLEILVDGVVGIKDPNRKKIYFLRRLPRDPLYPDASVLPQKTWGKRSYASSHEYPSEGADVFDVYSLSKETGLNGVPYRDW